MTNFENITDTSQQNCKDDCPKKNNTTNTAGLLMHTCMVQKKWMKVGKLSEYIACMLNVNFNSIKYKYDTFWKKNIITGI